MNFSNFEMLNNNLINNNLNLLFNFKPMLNENLVERNKTKRMTFVICFGLPGCGKSTFTTRLQQWCNDKEINCGVVSRDIFRYREDGSYKFDPEREPMVQNAHLELLYQLSEERGYDIVIVDDANLKYEQIISTLIAIDHEYNDVFIVEFEPFSPFEHMDRTKRNGHIMPLERLVFMRKTYLETSEKIAKIPIDIFRVEVPSNNDTTKSFSLQCKESMEKTLFSVFARINSVKENRFMLLYQFVMTNNGLKRDIFERYKESVTKAMLYEPDTKRKKDDVIKESHETEEGDETEEDSEDPIDSDTQEV